MPYRNGIIEAIGNTPLIKLKRASEETGCLILGKAEFMNPGQSVKDRAALFIIRDALNTGKLQPGGTVIPAGFGGTAYADHLAAAVEVTDGEIAQRMLRETQTRLFDRFPVIPLWSPTVATGFGAGVADVRLGWNGVPLYADIVPVDR